jgi:hypothetical protein
LAKNKSLHNTRTGGWGKCYVFALRPPLQKNLPPKIFGFRLSNLTLQSREARGVPRNQWLSLATAKENPEKLDASTLLVRLYADVRTHSTRNIGL